jgi:hypothetical protein
MSDEMKDGCEMKETIHKRRMMMKFPEPTFDCTVLPSPATRFAALAQIDTAATASQP